MKPMGFFFFRVFEMFSRKNILAVAMGLPWRCDWWDYRFHNCVRESEKALLVSTKGITTNQENWIEQHSKQDSYLIQRFYS